MTIVLSEDRMSVNLNTPAIQTGALTAADLDRTTNPGRVWPQPLTTDELIAQCCAPEGGQHADPVPTISAAAGARIGAVLMLISAVSVVGVIGAAVLARWPLF